MRTKTVLQIALIIFVTSGIWSCTRKVYVPVQSTKVEYRDKIQKDSIYMLDSVRIVERNDTVFNTKYKTTFQYRNVRDSIYLKDTIKIPFEVEKIVKVEKQLSWYQNICIKGFSFLLAAIAGYFVVTFRKKIWTLIMLLVKKIV